MSTSSRREQDATQTRNPKSREANTSPCVLEAIDVVKRYGALEVLRGVSLKVAKGQVLCIIGPSGSGKSTLLRCINHLEPIDSGRLYVDGELVGYREDGDKLFELREKEVRARRKRIGMVFQQFNLFGHMTALENVRAAPIWVSKVPRSEANELARNMLARVGVLDKADAYPSQLSGGQQQRVAVARALAMDPVLMLLDEPTSALDPELVGEVLSVIAEVAATGMTMIVVTHEMSFARDVCDELVVMDEGRVIEYGEPSALLANPSTDRAKTFLARLL